MKKTIVLLLLTAALALGMSAGILVQVHAGTSYDPESIDYYLYGGGYWPSGNIHTNNLMDVTVSSDDGSCTFRTGPGLSYGAIQPIYNGTQLYITAVSQNYYDSLVWGQTTYNGMTGWISLRLTTVTNIQNSSRAEYDVTVTEPDYIYLRRGPGAEYAELYRPYNGQVLRIYQTCVNSFDGRPWGRTTINGLSGWVSLDWTARGDSWTYNQARDVVFYNNQYYAYVNASDGFVNLRTGPGISCPVIQPIYNGNTLFVAAAVDNSADGIVWGLTTYNGSTGWIAMNATTITSIENASHAEYSVSVENSGNIRLREGPGTEYGELVSYIPNGQRLYITETVINSFDGRPWGKTWVNGYSGWVSLDWTYRAPGT